MKAKIKTYSFITIMFLVFLMTLTSCNSAPMLELKNGIDQQSNLAQVEIHSTVEDDYKNISPENDIFFKELLKKIISQEILLSDNGHEYYFDENNTHDATLEYTKFYILDMDGDNVPEIGILSDHLVFYKYNERYDRLDLWQDYWYQEPLGNGHMFYYNSGIAGRITYMHIILNSEGKEIYRINFSVHERQNTFIDTHYDGVDYYTINDVEVNEEQWKQLSAYLFNMKKSAEKAITYEDLIN